MKIAFDYQTFMSQSFGGVSRYYMRLAQELSSLGEDARIIAPIHRNRYLGEVSKDMVYGSEFRRFPPKSFRLLSFANRILCEREIARWNPDILHETYYSEKCVNTNGGARILTIYDMIHEKFRDDFSRRDRTLARKKISIARADHIIAISQNTKRDLCDILAVPEEKVSVVHLGFDSFLGVSSSSNNMVQQRPFLLYVGSRAGYKNFRGLLGAVSSRPLLKSDFDIIAFGGGKFSDIERNFISSLGFRAKAVQQIGGDDSVLGDLYRAASAFVYPSLYEGFGLPPLEAMAHDCPVVASNTSSMPEVIGVAGEYFDPFDSDDLADAICRVVFDKARQADLIVEGQKRLELFSWTRCAAETRDIYKQVLEG